MTQCDSIIVFKDNDTFDYKAQSADVVIRRVVGSECGMCFMRVVGLWSSPPMCGLLLLAGTMGAPPIFITSSCGRYFFGFLKVCVLYLDKVNNGYSALSS